jgi:hypothetical protein
MEKALRPVVDVGLSPGAAGANGSLDVLRDAIGSGEIVTIVYMSGSQPGTKRDVQPRTVTRSHLGAVCLEANERRTFLMEHVRVVASDAEFPRYNAARGREPARAAGLSDVLARNRDLLEAMGWAVVASEDAITLHATGNDGAVLPDVAVAIGRETRGNGKASWIVVDARGKRRSRKLLKSAVALFLNAAQNSDIQPEATSGGAPAITHTSHPPLRASQILLWLLIAFGVGLAVGLVLPGSR